MAKGPGRRGASSLDRTRTFPDSACSLGWKRAGNFEQSSDCEHTTNPRYVNKMGRGAWTGLGRRALHDCAVRREVKRRVHMIFKSHQVTRFVALHIADDRFEFSGRSLALNGFHHGGWQIVESDI
jgi:hypothetical protein